MCALGIVYQLNGQCQRAYDMYMQVIDEGQLVEGIESSTINNGNIVQCGIVSQCFVLFC